MAHSGAKESANTPSRSRELFERGAASALEQALGRLRATLGLTPRGSLTEWVRDSLARSSNLIGAVYASAFHRVDGIEPRRREALQAYFRRSINDRIRMQPQIAGATGVSDEATPSLAAPVPKASRSSDAGPQKLPERHRVAFARLDPTDQQLIVARFDLGCSYDQIALATGRSSGNAARVALRKALVRLAEEIGSTD